jgi:hypothetical protein
MINRFDAIRWNYSGGWEYSPDDVKKCEDGEMVKCEDVVEILDKFFKLSNDGKDFEAGVLLAKLRGELSD